ncbi:beta-D-glucosyl crocetin beta-1,6-glucosyltransferase, partial [Sarracenia purpurea var. burkii]
LPVGKEIRVEEALPEGFIDRVGDRGMVVEGWAPQARILGHSSTGGFVSHCGWGSVLESIKFCVPIIAMPMQIDQPLNTRVVEEVGAGLKAKRDKITGRLDREEITRVVRMIMVEEKGMVMSRGVKELSEKMEKENEMDEVVDDLAQLCG